jgi:hypothetical protein
MKTNVFILIFALMFGLTTTAQETTMLKRKGDIASEKTSLKTNLQSVSNLQTKKLSKFLNLSDSQIQLVSELVGKHLKSEKYADLISKFSGNSMTKSVQKSEGFDPISAELYNDKDFTKDINEVLDDKQKESYKEMLNKYLTPR